MLALIVAGAMLTGPDVVECCAGGNPMLAVATEPGLGKGSSGVVVALWPDGVLLRARVPSDPSKGHVSGNLSPADLKSAIHFIESSAVWRWKQPLLALDLPDDLVVVCTGERRHSWRETQGMDPASPLPRIRTHLLRLPLTSTMNPDATQPAGWRKWFERPGAEAPASNGTP